MKTKTNMTNTELMKNLAELREKLRSFRFGLSGSKSKNVKEGRETRKEIARMITALEQGK
jgi:ribosomal protein L29